MRPSISSVVLGSYLRNLRKRLKSPILSGHDPKKTPKWMDKFESHFMWNRAHSLHPLGATIRPMSITFIFTHPGRLRAELPPWDFLLLMGKKDTIARYHFLLCDYPITFRVHIKLSIPVFSFLDVIETFVPEEAPSATWIGVFATAMTLGLYLFIVCSDLITIGAHLQGRQIPYKYKKKSKK